MDRKEVVAKLRDQANWQDLGISQFNEFMGLFASRLENVRSDEVEPMGFVLTLDLLIADHARGIDGFTGNPMKSGLMGIPGLSILLGSMKRILLKRLTSVMSEKDAEEVLAFAEKVRQATP